MQLAGKGSGAQREKLDKVEFISKVNFRDPSVFYNCLMTHLLLFQESAMNANNSSRYPYEACLIPNLSEEIQHQVRDISNYVVRPLYMLFAVMAFVCNVLVCVTVARTKSLQRPSLLTLCSLSVTDLIYARFSLYMGIKTVLSEHMCLGKARPKERAINVLSSLATLGTLAVISRDRYLAVTKPWWYRSHVNKSRAIKISCIPWIISVALTLVHIFYFVFKFEGGYKQLAHTIPLVYYCVCFIIIVFSHLGIYFKKPPAVGIGDIRAVINREKKSAATIRLILLVLLLTFLPALLWPIVLGLKGTDNVGPYRPFISFLFTLDTLVNPLLNFGRSKDMRRAVKGLFRCYRHVQQQQQQQQRQQFQSSSGTENAVTLTTGM